MKKTKRIINLMLSTIMCCAFFSFTVSSDEYSESDMFYPCAEKIDCFNEKYGTRFYLDENNSEAILYYFQMTDEEFENFFLELKRKCEIWLENGDLEKNDDGIAGNESINENTGGKFYSVRSVEVPVGAPVKNR